ncbi:MAG: TlpA family protein disulfide reductase [Actinomycetota bacterium]|nr:TlpA family protein disulfide reductase [Actinomycetota bacterium]
MPWRPYLRLLLQAAAVGVVGSLIGLLAWHVATKEANAGLVDAVEAGETPPAPTLDLPALEGNRTISLASYRGKAVVLNFWASWCEPCKREAPILEDAWRRHRERGLVVLGVDAQDFRTDARRFVGRYGISYPVAHDGPGSSLGRFGLTGFPETWFVDRRGRLVAYVRGELSREELDANIEKALAS